MVFDDITGKVVAMVVMVGIHGQCFRILLAEQFQIGRIIADGFRVAMAANMLVQTDDLISGRHDQVQIMGYQQHAALMPIPNIGNQSIQLGLSIYIHALGRFIKYQQLGVLYQGPGQ